MANIMIVDDSPIIRRSLRGIFETMGHRVAVEAADGKEAIEAFDERSIDLVTMDIQLPGISGIEAVRRIRERSPGANIVMISSVEHRHKIYEAIKYGAKHYILKPYTEDKVGEVVRAVLNIRTFPQREKARPENPQPTEPSERFAKPQRREPLSLKSLSLSALPFELAHREGRIVLTIQRHISDSNIGFLHVCLQGLLYYRKAKYVVELWEPIFHDEGMRLLLEFVSAVRARKGTVAVVAEAGAYYAQLKAKLKDGVYRSSAEIEW